MDFFNKHFTVIELRDWCEKFAIPKSGVKKELIDRLIVHITNEIMKTENQQDNNMKAKPTKSTCKSFLSDLKSQFVKSSTVSNKFTSSSSSNKQYTFRLFAIPISTAFQSINASFFWKLFQCLPAAMGVIGGVFAIFRAITMLYGETTTAQVIFSDRFW